MTPTIQKALTAGEHQPCLESREVTYCMYGKVVLFRGRLVNFICVVSAPLRVKEMKTHVNRRGAERRDYAEELLIPQLV